MRSASAGAALFGMNLSVTPAAHGQALLRTTSQSRRKLLASSPSRGASGEEARLSGMPRLPSVGELSAKQTERLKLADPAPKTQQKTFRRIKQKNIGKTVDIPDENGYYITVARPTQG